MARPPAALLSFALDPRPLAAMPDIADFIFITEVDPGPAFAADLFRHKYQAEIPDFPHHVVAFWKRDDGSFETASYVHFTDCGDILLAGGGATSGAVIRRMPAAQREALSAYGGLMLATLRYGFARWGQGRDAVFTCCGDARALETTPKVGFEETATQYLLVRWMRALSDRRKAELTAKAKSFMPF
jgi:hypothetical protein